MDSRFRWNDIVMVCELGVIPAQAGIHFPYLGKGFQKHSS
jgi:hypothetical protein